MYLIECIIYFRLHVPGTNVDISGLLMLLLWFFLFCFRLRILGFETFSVSPVELISREIINPNLKKTIVYFYFQISCFKDMNNYHQRSFRPTTNVFDSSLLVMPFGLSLSLSLSLSLFSFSLFFSLSLFSFSLFLFLFSLFSISFLS